MSVEEVSDMTMAATGAVEAGTVETKAVEVEAVEAEAEAVFEVAATKYAVHPDYRVNVRSGPGTGYSIVRVLSYGATVTINCQKPGETIAGPYGTTNLWDNIANGQYISDSYVYTGKIGYVTVRCS
ncbi:SH3 domain-containing protein [Streptomyces paludis]|uniref:SH3 domain-containing protein n=1 Tax=Streptomyces paludis TaxID=2282738 RepID=A0A345HP67_9ACTN|nr:SH3 domain-containing protein [Streptomyces paludis]AXG78491.1 SH3 domain-containing protein [Streptomyces paludis]